MKTEIYNLNNLLNLGWQITDHDKQHDVYYLVNKSDTLSAQVYASTGNVFYFERVKF